MNLLKFRVGCLPLRHSPDKNENLSACVVRKLVGNDSEEGRGGDLIQEVESKFTEIRQRVRGTEENSVAPGKVKFFRSLGRKRQDKESSDWRLVWQVRFNFSLGEGPPLMHSLTRLC